MKSEKAREFIDGCINNLTVDMADHAERQLRLAMTHTAELAEQEAEERMRAKAKEAFISCCDCEEFQYDGKKCENCDTYKSFIKKLTENENN